MNLTPAFSVNLPSSTSLLNLAGASSEQLYRVAQQVYRLDREPHVLLYLIHAEPLDILAVDDERIWQAGTVLPLRSDFSHSRHLEHLLHQPLVADQVPLARLIQNGQVFSLQRTAAVKALVEATRGVAQHLDARSSGPEVAKQKRSWWPSRKPALAPVAVAAADLMQELNRAAHEVMVHRIPAEPSEWDEVMADA